MAADYRSLRLEWEGLEEPYGIDRLKAIPGFKMEDIRSIRVFRDEEYKIRGEIRAQGTGVGELCRNRQKGVAGEAVPYLQLEGFDPYGTISYKLRDCFFTNVQTSYSNLQFDKPLETVEIDLIVNEVERAYVGNLEETSLLLEWFLNGVEIPFPRSTDREYTSSTTRSRYGLDEAPFIIDRRQSAQGSRDCAYIRYNDKGFILFRVLPELGPGWSRNFGIEYRKEWLIPEAAEREAIAEVLGFVLGTQLLKVGYTQCDDNYFTIRDVSRNPAGKNVMTRCKESKTSPLGLDYTDIGFKMEEILSPLVSSYLQVQEELNLDRALWRYWVAQDMPLGTNLPVLATGLEILANAWFKSARSTGKSTYMEHSEFARLLEEDFSALSVKLSPYPFGERIVNKLRSSNHLGINEKIEKFLKEIGLSISQMERAALRARNKMAHGSLLRVSDTAAVQKTLRLSRAYEVLFERVFLKLLGYKGLYVDKTIAGWPLKHIDLPAGAATML